MGDRERRGWLEHLVYDSIGPYVQSCMSLQTSLEGAGDVVGSHTVGVLNREQTGDEFYSLK